MPLTFQHPNPPRPSEREVEFSDEELAKIYPLLEPGVMLGCSGYTADLWRGEDHIGRIRPRLADKLHAMFWTIAASTQNGFDCWSIEHHNHFYTLKPDVLKMLKEHKDKQEAVDRNFDTSFRMRRAVRRVLDLDKDED